MTADRVRQVEDQVRQVQQQTREECVARGIAFLDEVQPGWEDRVDTGALDIMSHTRCVLGQVFETEARDAWYKSGYWYAIQTWPDHSTYHGFAGGPEVKALWVTEIERRQAAKRQQRVAHLLSETR